MLKKTWSSGLLAGIAAAGLTVGVPAAHASASADATSSSSSTTLPIPPLTVQTDTTNSKGDIFIAPFGDSSTYANGAEILSPNGKKVIWFHRAPAGEEDADFRTQTYDGQQVLTFWQGTNLGGVSTGEDLIYNDRYQLIATVKAGNGYSADGHEFLITPWNTALVLSYTTATANLTSIGGPSDQTVIDGLVQEIDIRTGKVLFQWNSADHVPYSESKQPLPGNASSAWDWFHINAVKLDSNRNLLIDSRDTWTTFDVSLKNGTINWQLGGKDSSFKLETANGTTVNNGGDLFAWQHDVEEHSGDTFTVFDNEAAGTANTGTDDLVALPYSRIDTIKVNFKTHVATLENVLNQPEDLSASSQGSAQQLADGGTFVGWGSLPYFSQFSASGSLVFNAELPTGMNTYRAYRLDWHPAPGK
jgi:hypothetical protein